MMRFLFLLLVSACSSQAPLVAASGVPEAAWTHQRLLTRHTLIEFNTDAYVAVFAAQTHQESTWRSDLVSRVGAFGPDQFMPSTAKWLMRDFGKGIPCTVLEDFNDFGCSIPAKVRYNKVLGRGTKGTANECEWIAMILAKYNGGGIKADRRMAANNGHDSSRWFGHTELFNGRNRAAYNFKENRDYPRKILFKHQPKFLNAGYRGRKICA